MDSQPTPSRSRSRMKKSPSAPADKPKVRAPVQRIVVQPVSPCEDLHERIQLRAYELFATRGYRQGFALDDWLEAEREILSQVPPA